MYLRPLLSIFILALLTSCATTDFVSSWKSPDAAPLMPKGVKVGAVVMLEDEASRRLAEDTLVREINAHGAQGIAGYSLMPDSRPATEAEARTTFDNAGVLGIIVMRPVSTDKEVVATSFPYFEPAYQAYWGGYYGFGWGNSWRLPVTSGTEVHTNTIVNIETLVYSLRQNRLIWAGRSRTTNPSNVQSLVTKLSRAAAKELQRQGLLSP